MVYLIGTNHELQHRAAPKRGPRDRVMATRSSFSTYLRAKANDLHATLIAEESAPEVLAALATESIPCEVAAKMRIEHCYCEPSFAQRASLGLPAIGTESLPEEERGPVIAKREKFWLSRLCTKLDQSILFICGASHVESFADLLRSNGIAVEILEPYFGREIYEP